MKKRIAIANFSLVAAVLFSMLFQSVHSIGHIVAGFTEAHCHHEYGESKAEITHQHHNFDHCNVCDFSFSTFIASEAFALKSKFSHQEIPYFFTATELPFSFSGSAYSLRGPPHFIVNY